MTSQIEFQSRSNNKATGLLALPEGNDKRPAVILLQEWWGLNGHIRSLLDRLSAAGFVTLAPDLYHGTVASNAEEAGKLMNGLNWGQALDEIAGAAAVLRAHPRSNGNVGVIGFCMGGALAFKSATVIEGLRAVVPFYGVPDPSTDYSKVTASILAHFAAIDQWAHPDKARAIKAALEANQRSMELHVYNAEHAFVNDTRPEVYHPENAKLAWQRSMDFLHGHLD